MQCMTVEPFTARVLVTNVDHVSSVGGIHEQPILLAPGRATVSALSGRRNLHCKDPTWNDSRSFAARQLLSKIQTD
jgi:hypothetical protein